MNMTMEQVAWLVIAVSTIIYYAFRLYLETHKVKILEEELILRRKRIT